MAVKGPNRERKSSSSAGLRALLIPYAAGRIRLFFFSVGIKLSAAGISGLGIILPSWPFSAAGIFLWLSWFSCISLTAVPLTDRYLKNRLLWMKPAAIIITILIASAGLMWGLTTVTLNPESGRENLLRRYMPETAEVLEGLFSYNDTTALFHQAGENLLRGVNPYEEANVITASLEHDVAGTQITPLRRGAFADTFPYPDLSELESFWQEAQKHPDRIPVEIASSYGYPAGSFLILAPFLLAGAGDIRFIFTLMVLASLVLIIFQARGEGRLIMIPAVLVSLELFTLAAVGDTGIMQLPFLLFGWVLWKKRWRTSAVLMGIAITIKQVSWVYMLFYLVLVYREMGWRRLGCTLGIAGVVFLAFNLPFAVLDPGLWLSSMAAVITDPLFPLGVGFVSLVSSGLVTVENSLLFNIASVLVLAAGLAWYYRYCRRFPHIGPVLAVLPFFFAWRSMWGYFFMADFIVLACIAVNEYSPLARSFFPADAPDNVGDQPYQDRRSQGNK